MATQTMEYLLDTTASTKREPDKAGGKIGDHAANLASVSIVAPMPVDPELTLTFKRTSSAFESATRIWMSYSDASVDILAGDLITVSGVFTDAAVAAVAPWPTNNAYQEIIISE